MHVSAAYSDIFEGLIMVVLFAVGLVQERLSGFLWQLSLLLPPQEGR